MAMNPMTRNLLIAVAILAVLFGAYYLTTTTRVGSTPDPTKPLVFSTPMSPDIQKAYQDQFAAVAATLTNDPTNLSAWVSLGTFHKIAGNYREAQKIWEFVVATDPKNYIAFNNLGDLYMNFLKDYPKAEKNFRAVVTLDPSYIDTYRNLYTLYRYLYKTNTSAAADILKEGLKNNPNNSDLLQLEAELKAAK